MKKVYLLLLACACVIGVVMISNATAEDPPEGWEDPCPPDDFSPAFEDFDLEGQAGTDEGLDDLCDLLGDYDDYQDFVDTEFAMASG